MTTTQIPAWPPAPVAADAGVSASAGGPDGGRANPPSLPAVDPIPLNRAGEAA